MITGALRGSRGPSRFALGAGIGVGIGIGIGIGFTMWLHTPADSLRSPTPGAVLRGDRIVSSMRLLIESFGSGLLTGVLVGRPGFGLTFGVPTALAFGFGGGFTIGLIDRFTHSFRTPGHVGNTSGWFFVTCAWFALRGQLPWRLMQFLDDAHRRGVLRQAGAVYQFRHTHLQDRLADPAPPAAALNPLPGTVE